MGYVFAETEKWPEVDEEDWLQWQWQLRHSLKKLESFQKRMDLTLEEIKGFSGEGEIFRVQSTPYYAQVISQAYHKESLRRIFLPSNKELLLGAQALLDPLGEKRHQPVPRIIHRYSDRVLFLATDHCSVYCRYCTRKHFTASGESTIRGNDYQRALEYIQNRRGIREVILSGGDPLTLSNSKIRTLLSDLRAITHLDLIRIGTRMTVVCPMRIDNELVSILKGTPPVYIMNHFNHPDELTAESTRALTEMADAGLPNLNQMVLLNGVNNHPAIVQALSRRLLYLRVKPYYMFQCDPSEGTDHLRTSVNESMSIQRQLWGHLSGLAMPQLSLDIPDGGGKAYLVPNFQTAHEGRVRRFRGWDGHEANYIDPDPKDYRSPAISPALMEEYEALVGQ